MAAQRILVIEDEAGARDALGDLLADEGYAVCTAASGTAGLERMQEFRPDTILCDYYLPDLNGLEVLREARSRALGARITFIAVTAECGGPENEATLRREADFFLSKPVDLSRLQRVLRRASIWDIPQRVSTGS